MPRQNIPSYRLHKPTGQAIVVLQGKMFYLGQYKSKESRAKYNALIAEFLANDSKLPPIRSRNEITCEELAVKFLEWAEGYYLDEKGKPTSSFDICNLSMGPLVRHYGGNGVSDFGPLSLVFLRDKWIEAGTKRETINKFCSTVKQAFKWGVAHELVPADVLHALQAVDNLKAGRTKAGEYEKVETVPDEIVDATLPFMQPVVRDMVQIQRLAGMRPQDVRNMRGCDIDRRGDVWVYKPFTHKNKHRKQERAIAIGPRAQAIITPYLIEKIDEPEACLFSPKDTQRLQKVEKRRKRKSLNKKGRVQPSQVSRAIPNPSRPPRDQYDKNSYNRAIYRASIKAGIEPWSPNQLRHSAGTEVRDKYGLEYAQAVLGHSNAKTTEIYAEINFEKAAKVMREIG